MNLTRVSKLRKLKSDLGFVNDNGTNITMKDLDMKLLRDELSSRGSFLGKLDFSDIVVNDELPNLVGQVYEILNWLTIDPMSLGEDLETEVIHGDRSMKLLKAPTSFGKTTKLPFDVYRRMPSHLVIVVEPNDVIAKDIHLYVKKTTPCFYMGSEHDGGLPTSGVLYTSARNLLLYLLRNPDQRNMREVILQIDESHTDTAEYNTLYMLINHGYLVVSRAFLTSATHKGHEVESKNLAGFVIRDEPIELLEDYEESFSEVLRSQIEDGHLRGDRLAGRTLVFLPDEESCEEAFKLFLSQGIKCMYLTKYSTYEDFVDVRRFLLESHVGGRKVVVSTNIIETGLTLPIDAVFDFSLAELIEFDIDSGSFRKSYRRITETEAIQRRGRCGRINHGRYKYVENWRDKDHEEFSHCGVLDLMLWFSLFGYKLPENRTKNVDEFIGSLRPSKAAFLLSVNLHPSYFLPYFSVDGFVLSNCFDSLKFLTGLSCLKQSTEYLEINNVGWYSYKVKSKNVVELFTPYPANSHESIINLIVCYDIIRNGSPFNYDNTVQSKIFDPSSLQTVGGIHDELMSIEEINYIRDEMLKESPRNRKGKSRIRTDTMLSNDSLLLQQGFKDLNTNGYAKNNRRVSNTSLPRSDSGYVSSKSIGLDEDQIKALIKSTISESMSHVAPPVPELDDKTRRKQRQRLRCREAPIVSLSGINENTLVMPLGCISMSLMCDKECQRFVKKLIRGEIDNEQLDDMNERKEKFVYVCQFYNFIVTKNRQDRSSLKYLRKTTPAWLRMITGTVSKLEAKVNDGREMIATLKEIIPNWKRLGLYLIPLHWDEFTVWEDDFNEFEDVNSFIKSRVE